MTAPGTTAGTGAEGAVEPDRILFGVDMASDRGTVVVCGSAHPDEMRLVQERLREAGHIIVTSDDIRSRGDALQHLCERETGPTVIDLRPDDLLGNMFSGFDFKPPRNRILPRRVLTPTTSEDHAAVDAAHERQARKARRRAALASSTSAPPDLAGGAPTVEGDRG